MENMAANAAAISETEDMTADTGVAAGGTTEETNNSEGNASGEVTQTQAFSRRLNEMLPQRVDGEIASVGLVNPFTGKPITSRRELAAYKHMVEADGQGLDPNTAAELADARTQLADYQQREQEAALLGDSQLAPLYEEYRDDVLAIVQMAREDGRDITLDAALRAVMAQNYDTILSRETERIRNETIEQYRKQTLSSPGAVGGAPTGDKVDYASMSSTDFAAMVERAKRGELKS